MIRCFWGCLLCAIALLVFRNRIAKFTLQKIGSSVAGNPVTVGDIAIDFSQISVQQFCIHEKDLGDVPQIEFESLVVVPSLWQGLRQGVWLRTVVLKKPIVHMRFDAQGDLLSKFPVFEKSSEPEDDAALIVPVQSIIVRDGAFRIHQAGRVPLEISEANLDATFAEQYRVSASIGDFLGGVVRLQSDFDSKTFEGSTHLSMGHLALDSKQLQTRALVPQLPPGPIPRLTCEAMVVVQHPPNATDLRLHNIDMTAAIVSSLDAIDADERSDEPGGAASELLAGSLRFRARNDQGDVSAECRAETVGGRMQFGARSNLRDPEFRTEAIFSTDDIDLGMLTKFATTDVPLEAIFSAQGQVVGRWLGDRIAFDAEAESEVSGIVADGIMLAEVNTKLLAGGEYSISHPSESNGEVSVRCSSEGLELGQLSERLELPGLEGACGFLASITAPLASIADIHTYAGSVRVASSRIRFDAIQVEPSELVVGVKSGVVNVELADLLLQLREPEEGKPTFVLQEQVPIANTAKVSATLSAFAPLDHVLQAGIWRGEASLSTTGIKIAEEELGDLQLSVKLADGVVSLAPAELRWRESLLRFAGLCTLNEDPGVRVEFAAEPIPLGDLAAVANQYSSRPLRLAGTAKATGVATLSLLNREFFARGTLDLTDAWFEKTRLGAAALQWTADPTEAHLIAESRDFLGGSYHCDAKLRDLDWTKTQVTANCRDLKLNRLVGLVSSTQPINGSLEGSFVIEQLGELEDLKAHGRLATQNATWMQSPIALEAKQIRLENGVVNVSGGGTVLSGAVIFDTKTHLPSLLAWNSTDEPELSSIPVFGNLSVRRVSLQRGLQLVDQQRELRQLSGQLGLVVVRDSNAVDQGYVGTINTSVDNLRWKQSLLASSIRTDGILHPNRFESRIDGNVAEGRLSGQVSAPLNLKQAATFRVSLDRVNLRRALAPVPALAASTSGSVSLSGEGQLGNYSKANLKLKIANLQSGDLEVREVRFPITCSYQLQAKRAQLQSHGGTVHLGGGMVLVDVNGSSTSGTVSMDTGVTIRNVNTARLLRGNSVDAGVINGTVTLHANRANGPEDLAGRFNIELTQLENLKVPGFDQLTQLVKLPQISGPTMRKEDQSILSGRIGSGVVRIENGTLSKGNLLVLLDGTASFAGRLDLDLIAITNKSGPADGLVSLASSPLMLGAPAPVAMIAKLNDALKDRTFYVHVGGTAARPALDVQPGRGLTQDTLRVVLTSTLGKQASGVLLKQPEANDN